MLSRRQLLSGVLCGTAGYAVLPKLSMATSQYMQQWLFSACDNHEGQHFIYGWCAQQHKQWQIPVAQRCHGASCFGRYVVFAARRPGTVMYIVDRYSGELLYELEAKAGTHFFGHSVFSPDGHYLYVTESRFANTLKTKGVVGVYASDQQFSRVAELPVHGIGPHELQILPDGKTLVVAVGGILTHPQRGREKLNLDSMQSSVNYIDTATGELKGQVLAPAQKLSLRHLAVTNTGDIVVGAQSQDDELTAPLLFRHSINESNELLPFEADSWLWQQHNSYIASVAVSADGLIALATSPRGNLASLWDMRSGENLASYTLIDVAGVAYDDSQQAFLLSNGQGRLYQLSGKRDPKKGQYVALQPKSWRAPIKPRWDNHLTLHSQKG